MHAAELVAEAQLQADHRRRLDKREHNEDGRSKQTDAEKAPGWCSVFLREEATT